MVVTIFLLVIYHIHHMNSFGAALADASALLLGMDRKLTRVQSEPVPLPLANPLPAKYVGMGDVTRVRKTVQFADGGLGYNNERLQSEWYPIQAPVCDLRDTPGVLGDSSRLIGRAPLLRRK